MASAVIGALRANLGLDSAQFSRGVTDAQRSLEELRSRFLVVAGAASALGAGLAALGKSTIDSGAEINKLAQISNAMPEEFQRWAAGAASVGIEQEKLGDILKDVNDRVGDFVTTGGGPMVDFFEQIGPKVGVTAKDFAKLSGPQALQLFVSSLEKAGVSQQQMTFYMEAMASDATALVPLLQNGGKAMEAMGDRAEQLGALIDNRTVASLARAKVAVTEASTVMAAFGSRIGAAVAPMIERMATAFVDLSVQGAPLSRAVGFIADNLERLTTYAGVAVVAFGTHYVAALAAARLATLSFAGSLAFLRGALLRTGIGAAVVIAGELIFQLGKLIDKAGGVGATFGLMKDVVLEAFERINAGAGAIVPAMEAAAQGMKAQFFYALHDMMAGFSQFMSSVASGLNAVFNLSLPTDGLSGALTELNKAGNDASIAASAAAGKVADAWSAVTAPLESLTALNDAVSDTGAAATEATEGVTRFGEGIDRIAGGGGKEKSKANKATEVLKTLRDELTMLTATFGMSEQAAAIWKAQREAGVSAASAEGQKIAAIIPQIDALNAANERIASTGEIIKSSLGEAFRGILSGAVKAKDAVSQLLARLGDMFLDAGFNALWSGISGGGGAAGFFGGIAKIFGFANGTPFAPGGLARVNERGGEIINLPRGSQVIPHEVSMQMARDSARSGPAALHITASFDETGNLYVKQVSREQAVSAVAAYDRNMPDRVKAISSNPRRK